MTSQTICSKSRLHGPLSRKNDNGKEGKREVISEIKDIKEEKREPKDVASDKKDAKRRDDVVIEQKTTAGCSKDRIKKYAFSFSANDIKGKLVRGNDFISSRCQYNNTKKLIDVSSGSNCSHVTHAVVHMSRNINIASEERTELINFRKREFSGVHSHPENPLEYNISWNKGNENRPEKVMGNQRPMSEKNVERDGKCMKGKGSVNNLQRKNASRKLVDEVAERGATEGKTCWQRLSSFSSSLSVLSITSKRIMMMRLLLVTVLFAVVNVPVISAENLFEKEVDPVFLEPVPNVTVAVGRDASLTCAVDHLGLHKVAWIHLDRQMIVSIHNHVITRQPRFTVTHDSHKTWTLQVTRVTEEDRGHYMCQVNTKPMISQTGFLQVVVPPNIVDKLSSKSNIVVREKDNVTLVCRAEGFPLPQIKWRREDSRPIETADGRKSHQLDGPKLVVQHVSRTHMGAYLCIATNGVPPSVSKRITLDVEFAPQMHVPNQLVGSPVGTEVQLECFVEAHPRAITYWEFHDAMVMNTSRVTTRVVEDRYKIHMTLTIRDLQDNDFGMYKCISKNSIAETDGSITLNKTIRPTSPPQTMFHGYDDEDSLYKNRGRQGRKEQYRKELEEARKRIQEEEERRREVEEARRREKEMERQRLQLDFDRGQRNQQATRVTHTQNASTSLSITATNLPYQCLVALFLLVLPNH